MKSSPTSVNTKGNQNLKSKIFQILPFQKFPTKKLLNHKDSQKMIGNKWMALKKAWQNSPRRPEKLKSPRILKRTRLKQLKDFLHKSHNKLSLISQNDLTSREYAVLFWAMTRIAKNWVYLLRKWMKKMRFQGFFWSKIGSAMNKN